MIVIGFVVLAILLVIVFIAYMLSNDIRYPRNNYPKRYDQEEKLHKRDKTEKEAKQFTAQLEELGYFKWTSSTNQAKVKAHIEKSYLEENIFDTLGDGNGFSLDYRTYVLNHEGICEGGVKEEFIKVARTLEKLGFVIDQVEQTLTDDYKYTLQVNNLEFDLTPTEYNSPDLDFVDFINLILERELKVEERVYAMDRGDGYELIFLDKNLYRFLNQSNISKGSKPFILEGY